ncbi:MAG: cytochrome c5 family protein [Gammaproteobacteria bacterium]|nr:cytochrome c5 family protein [Gammaproteobacteria bacterium]
MNGQDRKFFDVFFMVLVILAGIAVGLFGLSRFVAAPVQTEWMQTDERLRAQVEERIRPIGRLVTDEAALEERGEVMEPAATVATTLTGPQVYNTACTSCHSAGIAGAPRTGDTAAWRERIAQGMDILYQHSIEGFLGEAGYMPPKGGRLDLSDEEIIAAVDFMIEEIG